MTATPQRIELSPETRASLRTVARAARRNQLLAIAAAVPATAVLAITFAASRDDLREALLSVGAAIVGLAAVLLAAVFLRWRRIGDERAVLRAAGPFTIGTKHYGDKAEGMTLRWIDVPGTRVALDDDVPAPDARWSRIDYTVDDGYLLGVAAANGETIYARPGYVPPTMSVRP